MPMPDGVQSTVSIPESRRVEREAAGPPPRDCGCYMLSDGRWWLNWGQHEGRCHVPLIERIEALERRVDELEQDDDDEFCDLCGDPCGPQDGSHYHCPDCGEVCSMMGHLDPATGESTCKPVKAP